MSEIAAVTQPPAGAKSLPARLAGVVFSPGETFRNIAAHPSWFGALAVTVLVAAGGSFALLSTQAGQDAMLDQQIRSAESWGGTVSDEQYAGLERMLPVMRYIAVGSTLVTIPIVTLLVAGALFGIFSTGLGGDASFRHVLAVVAHAGAIGIVQQIFTLPLNHARESLSSATSLGVFLPFLEEGSLPGRFVGMIDLFIVWWVVVLAIGLAVLYRRRAQPILLSLLGAYVVIAGVIAGVMRIVAGSQ